MAAMRSGQSLAVLIRALITCSMESSRGATRYLSGGKGKVLGEEERAAKNVYIQEKAEKAEENADKMNERELLALGFSVSLTNGLKGKNGT